MSQGELLEPSFADAIAAIEQASELPPSRRMHCEAPGVVSLQRTPQICHSRLRGNDNLILVFKQAGVLYFYTTRRNRIRGETMHGLTGTFCAHVCTAAAAVLVSWQVMIPAEEQDVTAISRVPLSQWGHEGNFDTLGKCLAYRKDLIHEAVTIEQAYGQKIPKWEIVRIAATCVSTDDPRLKKK